MLFSYNKVVFNYQLYNKFLSFSKINNRVLLIKGFFGCISLSVPRNIILEIDNKSILIFFTSSKKKSINGVIKAFCVNLFCVCYGLIFSHFIDLGIKGIGYKFELKDNYLVMYSGNSLPTLFKVPKNLCVLSNLTSNLFSIVGGDYILLNNFAHKIKKISTPNKYKEIGVYLAKRI